jgi:hypothetical protein
VETLTTLVDLGYDGTLVSGELEGQVLYEIRIGPYDSLDAAEAAGHVLQRSEDLTPTILVQPPEQP